MFEVEIDAAPEALAGLRHHLRAWLAETDVGDDVANDALLAVSEAATNVVEHAYPDTGDGAMVVSASINGGELWLHVEDNGIWKTPRWEESMENGRGLQLIRGLMDEVVVHTCNGGTRVHMLRKVEKTPPS